MTQQRFSREWVRGRRGYLGAGLIALMLVVLAVARFAPPADVAVAETAAPEAAAAAQMGGAVPGDGALPDSLAAGDSAAASASGIVLEGAADAELFGFAPIEDGVPRMRRPSVVKGLYLNAWAAGSDAKLDRLIRIANETEINAFVIDVKEGGEISYRSRVPLARAIGADRQYIADPRAMLRKLRANGIYPIARIVVFKDGVLSKARPDWAVQHVDGGDWLDNDGYRWVDSFNQHVWDYNVAIAREALELGFAEVQWDYVRFPDVPQSLMRQAVWPAAEGRTKADGIRDFLLYSRDQLAQYDVEVTADVFGLTTSARSDMGIGQLWEKMADATDVLLPMVYPSHYVRGSYGIAHPNASPYETVKTALEHAVRRSQGIDNAATVRAWLQDFTLGQPRYDASYVRAQIDAVYDAGLKEWVLWHPGSNYTVGALASADGKVPDLPRPSGGVIQDTAPKRKGPLGTPIKGG
ncbi:MAG TPA: putative glycoside hydrolase [Longimicrobiales bacterium]